MPRPHPAATAATASASSVSFDDVEQCLPGFHFGRFDVNFERLSELQPGRDVAIAGVNGAGAERTLSRPAFGRPIPSRPLRPSNGSATALPRLLVAALLLGSAAPVHSRDVKPCSAAALSLPQLGLSLATGSLTTLLPCVFSLLPHTATRCFCRFARKFSPPGSTTH